MKHYKISGVFVNLKRSSPSRKNAKPPIQNVLVMFLFTTRDSEKLLLCLRSDNQARSQVLRLGDQKYF